MHNLNLQQISDAQLLNMADGLVRGGNYGLARQLYGFGVKSAADPAMRRRFRVREGLVAAPTAASQALVEMTRTLDSLSPNVFVGEGIATWLKALPFMEDERFVELAARHAGLLPIANWHWNLHVALWAMQEAAKVEGDFVELGVFKGHTTRFCADYLGFTDWPRKWWLYDTFEGIPADQLDPGWEKANAETYGGGAFSYAEVVARFADTPNIEVIQGRVPEILLERSPEKIAFMHVDLNNATAEIAALTLLFDRLTPGGAILFDDYGWATASAQRKAEAQWFADRGLSVLLLPTGQGLFLKR